MADEYLILDHDALADERVRRDLASGTNLRPFLDLDESPDLGLVTNLAAIEVDERRLKDVDVLTKADRVGYWHGETFD
jgi:hypothetical protein